MKQVCRKSLALTKNLTKDKQVKKQTKRTKARLDVMETSTIGKIESFF